MTWPLTRGHGAESIAADNAEIKFPPHPKLSALEGIPFVEGKNNSHYMIFFLAQIKIRQRRKV